MIKKIFPLTVFLCAMSLTSHAGQGKNKDSKHSDTKSALLQKYDLNKDGKLSREELCIRISKNRGIPIKGEQPQPVPDSSK